MTHNKEQKVRVRGSLRGLEDAGRRTEDRGDYSDGRRNLRMEDERRETREIKWV